MSTPRVIVIGAGISGLTAAYQLQKAGCSVQVLEARSHPGGRMLTVDWEGFKVDPGAKFVTTSDRFLLEMVSELGLQDQIVRQGEGLTIVIYRDGSFHRANFLSIPSYLGWSGVSPGARLAMLKLLPHFLRTGKLDNVYHLEAARGADDQTMEAFFYEKISAEMYEYWAQPMFETMCSYTGEDISAKAFLAMLAGYMNADSVTFKDGIGALPTALAHKLDVQYGARVSAIQIYPDASGARLTYRQDGAEQTADAARVVVAAPGNHVLPLFAEPRPAWRAFFPQVAYTISAMQYHVCQTDYQPPVPGVFIPRLEKLPVNSFGFEQYQDGRWLMLSDPRVSEFSLDIPDETLIQRAVAVSTQLFPALQDTFVAHRIFRWAEKVPTFRPGYLSALAQFWSDPQESPVYFCGDYFAGPSTGGALYSGKECAGRVMDSI
jgi:oxygen-dependent protoporphyrinogen oxidase